MKMKTPYYLLRFTDLENHTTEWKEGTFGAICGPLTECSILIHQKMVKGIIKLYKIVNENEFENEQNILMFLRVEK